MKYIISLTNIQKLDLNDIQKKMRSARNTNDYLLVKYHNDKDFIKVTFSKDNTYTIGHNIWNMEFWTKLKVLLKQYPKSVPDVLAMFLTTWINKLNK